MIGLDTNVLIRYLTQDDPIHSIAATRAIESAGPSSLFISSIVICEIVWVLEDGYHHSRHQITEVIEMMLLAVQFTFENKDLLWQALSDYRQARGDYSDYLIGRIAARNGCVETITFDKALRKNELFRVL